MTYLPLQLWTSFIPALLLGGLCGWLFHRWLRGGAMGESDARLRAEIDSFKNEAIRVRASLTAEQDRLRLAEGSAIDLESRLNAALAGAGFCQSELTSARGQLASSSIALTSVTSDLQDWKTRFAELEPFVAAKSADLSLALSRTAAAEKQFAAKDIELRNSQVRLKERDSELNKLRTRLAELEPLPAQLADSARKVTELTTRLAAAAKEKDAEIDRLRQVVTARDHEFTGKETRHRQLLGEKENELARLRVRAGELEPLMTQVAERDRKISDWDARFHAVIGERDAEIARLRMRMEELSQREIASEQLKANFQKAAPESDKEMARLTLRITELDRGAAGLETQIKTLTVERERAVSGLRAQLADWEKRYQASLRDWDRDRVNATLTLTNEKNSALASAQTALALVHAQLADRDQKLTDWELRFQNFSLAKDAESEALQAEIADRDQRLAAWDARFKAFGLERDSEMQKSLTQLSSRDRTLSEWEARLSALTEEKDNEILQLRVRLGELEPLQTMLAERDRKLADSDARHQATVNDHEAEIAPRPGSAHNAAK